MCNAQHVKNVPGRKTDIADAQWLADVVAHGMVRPSLVPDQPIRAVRELTRYRKTPIRVRAQEIQRLEKVLQDAGIKLSSVASRVLTKSGRAMIEALIAGEGDPAVLADLALRSMRTKIGALTEALNGRFKASSAQMARRILDHIDFLDATIADLDTAIAEELRPFDAHVGLLVTMVGWQRRTAGGVLRRDRRRHQPLPLPPSTWPRGLGSVPPAQSRPANADQSARNPGKTWLNEALIEAAQSAVRSKDTYFSATPPHDHQHGRYKAVVAVAHTMVITAWHMLTTGETYHDPGADYFQRRREAQRETERLVRQLENLGHTVTLNPAPNPSPQHHPATRADRPGTRAPSPSRTSTLFHHRINIADRRHATAEGHRAERPARHLKKSRPSQPSSLHGA